MRSFDLKGRAGGGKGDCHFLKRDVLENQQSRTAVLRGSCGKNGKRFVGGVKLLLGREGGEACTTATAILRACNSMGIECPTIKFVLQYILARSQKHTRCAAVVVVLLGVAWAIGVAGRVK